MAKEKVEKLSLTQPTSYQIKVLGCLEESWTEWAENIIIKIEYEERESPATILTCTVDQAALLGLLRRLYSLGLPLISVDCLEMM
jgi:hypothetical protein